MADSKISDLASVTAVAGANEFAVNEAGTSKKASATQIAAFLGVTPASSSAAGSLDLYEDTDNGGHKVKIIAPAAVASDKTATLPDETFEFGFRNIPQNSQSDNYTCVLADAGKHVYETGASKTVTIPANASVAYEVGTTITFVATDAGGCSIAITSDTLRLAGSATTGTRTLAQYGVATAIKVAATTWIISGTGLT